MAHAGAPGDKIMMIMTKSSIAGAALLTLAVVAGPASRVVRQAP
jgi:hypothetical protein